MLSPHLAASAGRGLRRRVWMGRDARRGPGLRLLRCRAGNSLVEFGLITPVLLLMMLASAELGRYVILNQKLDRVATTTSDLVARAETISESQIDDIFAAAEQAARPFDLAGLGSVIVSSITNLDGTEPVVAWQRSGGGSYAGTSRIGTEGNSATLPGDFEVREGETVIISEVYYDFSPFLSELVVTPQLIYRRAYFRPRLGLLDEVEPG